MISFFKRSTPIVRERAAHGISRANIDPDALKVLYRLADTGHIAYLVGGSVRDLLLGRQPKDFDVGTDARPNEIRRLFRNCFLIGRRFRLAHIVFGKKIIETSTFRKQPEAADGENGLYQTEDNTFGTPEEDAKRRDFTVNGLFYDIKTFSVIDYVDGLRDLEKRVLRCIGDPNIRFREDPVRMMRAVKFAARLGFRIDRASCKAIAKHHADILNASVPRVCEEVFRLFGYGSSRAAFTLLWEFRLLHDLLPDVSAHIDASGGKASPLWNYLAALDADPAGPDLSNGVRIACLAYPLFLERLRREEARLPGHRANRLHVAHHVLNPIAKRLCIPKSVLFAAAGFMDSLRRFDDPPCKSRGQRFIRHRDFPDALAFRRILLAAEGGDASSLGEWLALHEREVAQHLARAAQPGRGQPAGEDDDGARRHSRRRSPDSAGHRPAAVTVTEVADG